MKRSERRRNDKRTVISSLCKRQEGLDLLMRWKRRRKTSRFSGRLIHRTRLHVVLKYNLCTIISADCTLGRRNKASLSRPYLARDLFHPNGTINAEEYSSNEKEARKSFISSTHNSHLRSDYLHHLPTSFLHTPFDFFLKLLVEPEEGVNERIFGSS